MPVPALRPPALAAAEAALPRADEGNRYLSFSLGDEMFAIDILSARAIVECDRLVPVPQAPPFIRGVVEVRGALIPVIDLAARFDRLPHDLTSRSCIVIIEIEGPQCRQELGVIIDAFSDLAEHHASRRRGWRKAAARPPELTSDTGIDQQGRTRK